MLPSERNYLRGLLRYSLSCKLYGFIYFVIPISRFLEIKRDLVPDIFDSFQIWTKIASVAFEAYHLYYCSYYYFLSTKMTFHFSTILVHLSDGMNSWNDRFIILSGQLFIFEFQFSTSFVSSLCSSFWTSGFLSIVWPSKIVIGPLSSLELKLAKDQRKKCLLNVFHLHLFGYYIDLLRVIKRQDKELQTNWKSSIYYAA